MATTYICPKGDQSDDPEFCSVCGTRMGPAGEPPTGVSAFSAPQGAPSPPATDTSQAAGERCPTCGLERKPGARFCENCRYDFKQQVAGPPPTPTAVAGSDPAPGPTAVSPAAPGPGSPNVAAPRYWEAVVTVDPTLDVEPDPSTPCPTGAPERTFPLDLSENLVGRRSANRGIFPEIALDDPGVSHRHVMVYRNPDASLVVADLGSTNGTFLNGHAEPLEAGVKTPVGEGDRLELGRWTRIMFCLRP